MTFFLPVVLGVVSFSIRCGAEEPQQPPSFDVMPARHEEDPGFKYFPSADDWRDINVYQVLTDRFFDGDPDNNDDNPEGVPDPVNPVGIHGGDFSGLTQKLDYLEGLGVRGIWISPVFTNVRGEYHGYAARDLNAVDPHWGGLAELREFIDRAHERGIYVFIDIVANHMGDLVRSGGEFRREGYELTWHSLTNRHAPPFDVPEEKLDEFFHAYGSIQNWDDLGSDGQAVLGDFMGLDDIRTSNPEVRRDLLRIYQALIAATDCDGFRVDTVKHVELDFWKPFVDGLRAYARGELGKDNLLIFGEALSYDDDLVSLYTRHGFNSMLDFPTRGTLHGIFVNGDSPYRLKKRAESLRDHYAEDHQSRLVTFLDNHDDLPRVMNQFGGDTNKVLDALTVLHTWYGIPLVYYGTEQGFDGGRDPANREDLFDGEYEQGPSEGDNFDPDHPLYEHIRRLNLLRVERPELRRGALIHRYPLEDTEAPGILAYSRMLNEERSGDETVSPRETLIVVNTDISNRNAVVHTDFPRGAHLQDRLNPGTVLRVGTTNCSKCVELQVSPGSARMLTKTLE